MKRAQGIEIATVQGEKIQEKERKQTIQNCPRTNTHKIAAKDNRNRSGGGERVLGLITNAAFLPPSLSSFVSLLSLLSSA